MIVVLCLFCVLFLGVADNQVLSPLLPAIRRQFAGTTREMSFLFTGYSLCAGLSVLIWGPVSDFFGRRRCLMIGLGIFMLGSIGAFLSRDFRSLLLARIITGMGASMLSLNTISYAADFFPYAQRGWAMGSIFSSYFAALILGVPIGSWIGEKLGWHSVFAMAGVSSFLLVVSARFALPRMPPHRSTAQAEFAVMEEIRTFLGFLQKRHTVGALLSSFCASAGTAGFLAFLGVWLHDAFNISGQKVGLVFLVSGAAALVASPLAGSLSDRIGKRTQFAISNVALALLLVVLPHLFWGPSLFGVFCAISLAAAFRQGPMEALLTEVVSPASRGSFIALKNSFSQLGIALAALLSGMAFESVGYNAVCWIGACANVAAAVSILFLVKGTRL
jgi:DHA1 family purine base/nucleoside efflux pump-like MFS transporter